MTLRRRDTDKVVSLIADAGGKIVGRTRLQKITVLLELAGEGEGFGDFEYRHYGPYSEELRTAADDAVKSGKISETERVASWGGKYSIFQADGGELSDSLGRRQIIESTKDVDAIVLELAATAAFLASEGADDPWAATKKLKLQKSKEGRLKKAKALYADLRQIDSRVRLPDF